MMYVQVNVKRNISIKILKTIYNKIEIFRTRSKGWSTLETYDAV